MKLLPFICVLSAVQISRSLHCLKKCPNYEANIQQIDELIEQCRCLTSFECSPKLAQCANIKDDKKCSTKSQQCSQSIGSNFQNEYQDWQEACACLSQKCSERQTFSSNYATCQSFTNQKQTSHLIDNDTLISKSNAINQSNLNLSQPSNNSSQDELQTPSLTAGLEVQSQTQIDLTQIDPPSQTFQQSENKTNNTQAQDQVEPKNLEKSSPKNTQLGKIYKANQIYSSNTSSIEQIVYLEFLERQEKNQSCNFPVVEVQTLTKRKLQLMRQLIQRVVKYEQFSSNKQEGKNLMFRDVSISSYGKNFQLCCNTCGNPQEPGSYVRVQALQANVTIDEIKYIVITKDFNVSYNQTSIYDRNNSSRSEIQKLFDPSQLANSTSAQVVKGFLSFTGILALVIGVQQPIAQMLLVNSQPSPLTFDVLRYFSYWVYPCMPPDQGVEVYTREIQFLGRNFLPSEDDNIQYQDKFKRVALSPLFFFTCLDIICLSTFLILLAYILGYIYMRKKKIVLGHDQKMYVLLGIPFGQRIFETLLNGNMATLFGAITINITQWNNSFQDKYFITSFCFAIIFLIILFLYWYHCFKMCYDYSQLLDNNEHDAAKLKAFLKLNCSFYLRANRMETQNQVFFPYFSQIKKFVIALTLILCYDNLYLALFILYFLNQTFFFIRIFLKIEKRLTIFIIITVQEIFLSLFYISIGTEFDTFQTMTAQVPIIGYLVDKWKQSGQNTVVYAILAFSAASVRCLINISFHAYESLNQKANKDVQITFRNEEQEYFV